MHCPICAKETDVLLLTDKGQRCRECKKLSPMQCYDTLIARIEASINEFKLLAHESFQRGDALGFWKSGQHVKELERQRETLRKP